MSGELGLTPMPPPRPGDACRFCGRDLVKDPDCHHLFSCWCERCTLAYGQMKLPQLRLRRRDE